MSVPDPRYMSAATLVSTMSICSYREARSGLAPKTKVAWGVTLSKISTLADPRDMSAATPVSTLSICSYREARLGLAPKTKVAWGATLSKF